MNAPLHQEFESPEIAEKKTADDVQEYMPSATALAAEIMDIFGEGSKTIYMAEGDKEIKTRAFREQEHWTAITISEYQHIGQRGKDHMDDLLKREASRVRGK